MTVIGADQVEMSNSRGTTNVSMKCKFCKSDGSINVELDSVKPYSIESSGQFAPLVILECRGWEPTEFVPTEGFQCFGENSGTRFTDIDLTELEWVEYDEKAAESVEIMGIEYQIAKA